MQAEVMGLLGLEEVFGHAREAVGVLVKRFEHLGHIARGEIAVEQIALVIALKARVLLGLLAPDLDFVGAGLLPRHPRVDEIDRRLRHFCVFGQDQRRHGTALALGQRFRRGKCADGRPVETKAADFPIDFLKGRAVKRLQKDFRSRRRDLFRIDDVFLLMLGRGQQHHLIPHRPRNQRPGQPNLVHLRRARQLPSMLRHGKMPPLAPCDSFAHERTQRKNARRAAEKATQETLPVSPLQWFARR